MENIAEFAADNLSHGVDKPILRYLPAFFYFGGEKKTSRGHQERIARREAISHIESAKVNYDNYGQVHRKKALPVAVAITCCLDLSCSPMA